MNVSVPYFMGEPLTGFAAPSPRLELDHPLPAGTPELRMGVLYDRLADCVATLSEPVVYAGDCVSAIGVLAGLQRRSISPTLVWFDAHGDFNTWETTPSGFLGGMPLAMIVGRGDQSIVAATGLAPLPEERAVLVGARDLDPGEDLALASSSLAMLDVAGVDEALGDGEPLYVHIDVDVVDPSDMPAVNYAAPAGPRIDDVASALRRLAASRRVVAWSFSCWNPALPGAERAAHATARLARSFSEPE